MKQVTHTLTDFPMPENPTLERIVIAELITFPTELIEAERIVNAEMFTSDERKTAWLTLIQMHNSGLSIDLTTFFTRANKDFMLKEVMPQISKIGSGISVLQHCSELREVSAKRKAYLSAIDLLRHSSCNTSTLNDIIDTPAQLIESINADFKEDKYTEKVSDTINILAEEIQHNQCARQNGMRTRIPTGFRYLNKLTYSGFNAGQLIILAARPSIGKTAIMLQMAKEAVFSGFPATIFSLEMTNTELAQRLLFSTEEIKPLQIVRGDMEWDAFERAAGQFASAPLYLNDKSRTIEDIISGIILNHRQGKCDIAFIDYLGLIQHSNSRQPLYQIIAEVTKRLKQVAKDCRIPIVLLCQLNRASASENRPPALFDLRDSGSIEQDADIVLMLERNKETSGNGRSDDDSYPSSEIEQNNNRINMWVRKNRQGKAGDIAIGLVANSTFTAFSESGLIQPE